MEYIDIEKSIIKKFRKELWSKFTKAVRDYELIKENDKVMVCISGGKDSFLLAKLIEELHKHSKINFDVCYVVMNPGYTDKNKDMIISNAKKLNLPITMFETNIFDIVTKVDRSPCYLCAKMRRGYLYDKAKSMGCNKIALGHHLDDVIETTLLSMFYGAEIRTMMPKLKSTNFEGLELIRPLYLIKEDDVKRWRDYNSLTFLNCACKFTEMCSTKEEDSKRLEMKKIIKDMKKSNPNIEHNIFKSLDNVNLNCVLGTKKDGNYNSFLEEYDN